MKFEIYAFFLLIKKIDLDKEKYELKKLGKIAKSLGVSEQNVN